MNRLAAIIAQHARRKRQSRPPVETWFAYGSGWIIVGHVPWQERLVG